jgi:hypothetical protein
VAVLQILALEQHRDWEILTCYHSSNDVMSKSGLAMCILQSIRLQQPMLGHMWCRALQPGPLITSLTGGQETTPPPHRFIATALSQRMQAASYKRIKAASNKRMHCHTSQHKEPQDLVSLVDVNAWSIQKNADHLCTASISCSPQGRLAILKEHDGQFKPSPALSETSHPSCNSVMMINTATTITF